ncbi:MAG: acyl-CoA dehydrogenase family protein [Acidimicrobiia bacterium]
MAIDFTLSEEQQQLQTNARAFAEGVLGGVADRLDAIEDPAKAFYAQRDIYIEFAKAGFTKSFIPAENGGLGFGMLAFAIAAEELARVDVNVPTTLLASGLGLQPIIQFGTAEQRNRFLQPFVDDIDGSLLASFAFTDVGGGANYDAEDPGAGIQTMARVEGDRIVVTGDKHYTTNGTGWDGNGAHLYTVVCRTDPSKGASESLAVVVVPGEIPGIEVVEVYDKLGQRGVVTPRVHFRDVEVPADHLVGRPGQGKEIISGAFSWTAGIIGAACVGVMRAAFDYAFDFCTRERRLGSVPIIEHQNVGFMLADARMRIEAARYLTWKACHYFDTTGGRGEELAIMAKVHCSELCVQTVYDLMRVVGVESYTPHTPLERLLRDALVFPLYDGGNLGVRRRQLHDLLRQPGYDQMLAAEGRTLTGATRS